MTTFNFCAAINNKMRFRENQFYKGNARLCFTKTKIVIDRVDVISFSKNLDIFT